mmetsp:Transcript_60017/g.95292  ORF Transcript_60017/g.95292 Transcript_60017/m.95292 type:complete len:201 (-) Transcript_60017:133-735(-)
MQVHSGQVDRSKTLSLLLFPSTCIPSKHLQVKSPEDWDIVFWKVALRSEQRAVYSPLPFFQKVPDILHLHEEHDVKHCFANCKPAPKGQCSSLSKQYALGLLHWQSQRRFGLSYVIVICFSKQISRTHCGCSPFSHSALENFTASALFGPHPKISPFRHFAVGSLQVHALPKKVASCSLQYSSNVPPGEAPEKPGRRRTP